MSEQNDLLDAVDRLTLPETVTVWQGARITRNEHPNLLEQLRRAVVSDIGGSGVGGKLANERTPLDVGAFTMFEAIDGRVRAWAADAGIESRGELAGRLRAWYVKFAEYPRTEVEVSSFMRVLVGWEGSIRDLLDPPAAVQITAPCPRCGVEWVVRGSGVEEVRVWALWGLWRERAEDSNAECRGCGAVWRGVAGMRRCRMEIDAGAAEVSRERRVAVNGC